MNNAQLMTGVVAALGLLANLVGVGAVAAQDGHTAHAEHSRHRADFVSDRLHVRVEGDEDGRDIILIPGLSSSPEVWQGTVDHLDGEAGVGWRVHRIHIQGFAGAPPEANATGPVAGPVAEEIARYITEKGLIRPVVVGHSMGGTIGMMLAARHPDLVGKLLVVDMVPFVGAMFASPGVAPTVEAVTPVVEQLTAQTAALDDAAYRARAAATVAGMIKTESLRAGPLRDAATSDRTTSQNAYRELLLTDLRPELPRITAPVEVLYVAFESPGLTPEITDAIYKASFAGLPGATLKRIDASAHFIMLDQPQAFYDDLDAFIAR